MHFAIKRRFQRRIHKLFFSKCDALPNLAWMSDSLSMGWLRGVNCMLIFSAAELIGLMIKYGTGYTQLHIESVRANWLSIYISRRK